MLRLPSLSVRGFLKSYHAGIGRCLGPAFGGWILGGGQCRIKWPLPCRACTGPLNCYWRATNTSPAPVSINRHVRIQHPCRRGTVLIGDGGPFYNIFGTRNFLTLWPTLSKMPDSLRLILRYAFLLCGLLTGRNFSATCIGKEFAIMNVTTCHETSFYVLQW